MAAGRTGCPSYLVGGKGPAALTATVPSSDPLDAKWFGWRAGSISERRKGSGPRLHVASSFRRRQSLGPTGTKLGH